MTDIEKVEGIGPVHAKDLTKAGIHTTEDLLREGTTPASRKEIEEVTGISHKLILKWVNMVDLFRIKGVSEEYSELLEEAGVDTVPELSQRNSDHLNQMLADINGKKNLVRRLPSENEIKDWIEQAKALPRVIKY
ncbi:MAG: DUF4332 domain-containing protein [Actinobacteria bacterium]|nr:DUF4332 domain-containing protein [Actinomycetota bacterium]